MVNILIVQVTLPPGLGSSSAWVSLCPHLLAISTPCQLFTPMIKDAISLLLPCKQNPHLHNCKTLLWLFYLSATRTLPEDPGKGHIPRCHFRHVTLQTLSLPILPHNHKLLLYLPLAWNRVRGCPPGNPCGKGDLSQAIREQPLILRPKSRDLSWKGAPQPTFILANTQPANLQQFFSGDHQPSYLIILVVTIHRKQWRITDTKTTHLRLT